MNKNQFGYDAVILDEDYFNKMSDALVVDDKLPVAVLDLQTLESLGDWEEILGVSKEVAVALSRFKDPVLEKNMSTKGHIWVNPEHKGYKDLWKSPPFESLNGKHLDHVHAKQCASIQGYGYVMLLPCAPSSNMSAGAKEKVFKKTAVKGHAIKNAIQYAEEVHWAKIWGILQLKIGVPVSEGKHPY